MELGERHNGKAVTEQTDGLISKPRTIYWEWLFLGGNSPLRELISGLSSPDGPNPMAGFPELDFTFSDEFFFSGIVEKLKLSPTPVLSPLESEIIGGTYSTAAWFGLTDLHFENMFVGRDKDGRFQYCPIDIECVFEDLEIFSQTQLVKSHTSKVRDTGSRDLIGKSLNVSAVCSGFLDGFFFYESHVEQIRKVLFKDLELLDIPKRVILNPTRDYVQYLQGDSSAGSLFHDEEIVQLRKGNVPYFYNTLSDDRLRFKGIDGQWTIAPDLKSDRTLPCQYQNSKLNRSISTKWIKNALCQICRTLDSGIDRRYSWDKTEVIYKNQHIYITTKNGWKIKCARSIQLYFAA